MIKALLCAALIAVAAPAVAGDAPQPRSDAEAPNDVQCYPLADVKNLVDQSGGQLIELTPEQFEFARGLFVATPPLSRRLPPGDHALIGLIDDRAGVLFIDGANACDAGVLPPELKQMLLDVGAGKIEHVGGAA